MGFQKVLWWTRSEPTAFFCLLGSCSQPAKASACPLGFVPVGTGGVGVVARVVSLFKDELSSAWWLKAMKKLFFMLNIVGALLCLAVLIN